MKNATEFTKRFKTFRRKMPSTDIATSKHGATGEVIYSYLLWNATTKQAKTAYKKLINASVDLNEIRVNVVSETIVLIGANYPQAFERAKRLRSVLNAIYLREHSLEVSSLDGAGKREIREYYETLNGITPFVCNRVIALQYGVAAMPVDDRTLAALITNNLIHEDADIEETISWLGRQVKADEVCDVHARIHAWVSLQPLRTISNPTTKKVPKKTTATSANGKKKTAKKTATKKKATVTKKKKKK